ncbi:MAG: hypothetical protein QOH61_402 [Chloroflexota bacterium]|jgi:cytoskeletal protein CcmA (bactofilin family)|nr:hypothetical protein [Chloroflexota bacterium]
MFSRSSGSTGTDDGRRGGLQPVGGTNGHTVAATQSSVSSTSSAGSSDQTVVAREDRIEGTIRAHQTVRVLGTVKGKLEAPNVLIEEGAKVTADVVADEVIVAGEYSGSLTCRQRLEVRPTGRVNGRVETLKLMLHEGATVDGEVHMIKAPVDEAVVRPTASVRGYSGSSARQAVASGSEPAG